MIIRAIRDYFKKEGGLWSKGGGFDIAFFAILVIIIITGLIMLFSATHVYAYYYKGNSAFFFKKQLIWAAIGFVLMLIVSRINFNVLKWPGAWLGSIGSFGLMGLALLMPAHNGTRRHIYIGGLQFQPSDIAKLALILTLAYILTEYNKEINSKKETASPLLREANRMLGNRPWFNVSLKPIVYCVAVIGINCILLALQKHLSGIILMFSIGVIMLYLGEVRFKWFPVGAAAAGFFGFIAYKSGFLAEYMSERIEAWLNKEYDPLGVRWQTNEALYAIGSGGFFGKGLGQSTLKHMYVSEPQNDMIFSIVVEELGFLGAAVIIILFALLVWRGVAIGIKNPSRYGALVAMGISFHLAVQVILNIAVATDSIPNTGISLPFFSYGGTALVVQMIEMGIVLSISRTSNLRRNKD